MCSRNFKLNVKGKPGLHWFALPRSVIGPENSRHSLNQSDVKQNKPRPGHSFFPAHFFLGSTYFLLVRLACVLITCWDYFVYGSYALNPRALES